MPKQITQTSQVEFILSQIFNSLPELSKSYYPFFINFFKVITIIAIIGNSVYLLFVFMSGQLSLPFTVAVTDIKTGEAVPILFNLIPKEFQFTLANMQILIVIKLIYSAIYTLFAVLFLKAVMAPTRVGWFFLVYSWIISSVLALFNNDFALVLLGTATIYVLHNIKSAYR
jgi:hypothetical protein